MQVHSRKPRGVTGVTIAAEPSAFPAQSFAETGSNERQEPMSQRHYQHHHTCHETLRRFHGLSGTGFYCSCEPSSPHPDRQREKPSLPGRGPGPTVPGSLTPESLTPFRALAASSAQPGRALAGKDRLGGILGLKNRTSGSGTLDSYLDLAIRDGIHHCQGAGEGLPWKRQ